MTKTQMSIAIKTLLERADTSLRACAGAEGGVWTAHMTASLVLSGLAHTLIEIKDSDEQTRIDQIVETAMNRVGIKK